MKPSWHEYFMAIAEVVATRSDCTRRQVGALVVQDNHIVSTGYNGAPTGKRGCAEAPCPRASSKVPAGSTYSEGPGRCIAIHAEANAIIYAGRDKCLGAILYCTSEPCFDCVKLIKAAGISLLITASDVRMMLYLSEEDVL